MEVDDTIKFYMRVPLPDGSCTDGRIDYTDHPDRLGLDHLDLSGARVLDIAANDGFWAFWAEQAGAREVVAIDVDSFDDYDWGYGGRPQSHPPASSKVSSQWTDAGAGFRAIHEAWDSRVSKHTLSVYNLDPDVHGQFDLVLMYGLLYHLRHPLLALDRIRQVCVGTVVIETHVVNAYSNLPVAFFYWDDVFRGVTNWTGPTAAVTAAWLRSAGFPYIFMTKTDLNKPNTRQVFVGCIHEKAAAPFRENSKLTFLDAQFYERMKTDSRAIIWP